MFAQKLKWILPITLMLALLGSVQGTQAELDQAAGVPLNPGSNLVVNCSTTFTVELAGDRKTVTLRCAANPTATPTKTQAAPTPTKTKTATKPPAHTSTNTPAPTATPVSPTATQVPPTATLTQAPTNAPASPTATSISLAGLPCPPAIHDQYVTTGPDGKTYPTWHPPIDPGTGCFFDHDHGDDPRTSLANSSMPAFGYVAGLSGMAEPHNGFKVFVANKGSRNDEGRIALNSTRIVAHMGTGGVARFDQQSHSFQFDLVADDGHYVHVQGMADTGLAGSICDRDRNLQDNNPNNDIGRSVMIPPGQGCDVTSPYEIWLFKFNVGNKLTVLASVGVFDPITVMNPADHTVLLYSSDVFGTQYFGGWYRGCRRESYSGPVYWYNKNGPTTYMTDPMGMIMSNGAIKQEISANNDIGIPMTSDQTQFKLKSDNCSSGLGLKN